jgi:glycosyltransferase involved in cell wall biosynthesis
MTPDAYAASEAPAVASPRISVIIPSYNSAPFLRQALTSVLDQVPRPHEVLVQDGGSADATLDILRSFGDCVAWVAAPDDGQSDALNRALARATGDVVLWLNADDVLLPGAIASASASFGSDPTLEFAYGDFDLIDAAGALMRRYQSSLYSWERVYACGCYIFSGSLFIRRQHLEAIGGFDPSLRACMDFDLLLRLDAAGRSAHLGRTIGQFRMHDASKSSTIGLAFLREGFRVRRRYARRSPRLWLVALWATARSGLMAAAAPLRYSSRWPRYGGGKTL